MATLEETVLSLLDRAISDPDFLEALTTDPLGTARAAGLQLSSEDLKRLMGLAGATDRELVEVLRTRILHARGGFSPPLSADSCTSCAPD